MKAGIKALAVFACTAGLAVVVSTARADGCTPEGEKEAQAQLSRAEGLERAGKLPEAFTQVQKIDDMCVDGRRSDALKQRVGKTLGGQEEKRGKLEAAFDWYSRARLDADADRVMLLQVKAQPENLRVFGSAYGHFKYRENEATLKELRSLAAKNADRALAEEDRAFTARMVSFQELDTAGDWLGYLGDEQMKRKADRAEKRGDALLVKDGLGMLENALRYYGIAGRPQKEQQVRDKAIRLGDGYVKTGETATAARFYLLAGADDKAAAVEKRAAEAGQKKEAKRQEQFRQEQDDLEKELGF